MVKRSFLAILMACAALSDLAVAEEPVNIPDRKLKAAVEDAIQTVDPTPTDMLGLTSLSCHDLGIADLTGLEYATNLVYLDLRQNRLISSVAPLAGLVNLQHLAIDNNQIYDISALAGLTNLQWLNLHENQISDISALAGMTQLEWLNFHQNQVSDISVLAGLTNLTYLVLNHNPVSDISALAALKKLRYLTLYEAVNTAPDCPLDEAAYCTYLVQIAANNPGIELTYRDNPTPPQAVAASDGTYPDKVRITWNGVCNGPEGYKEPHYYIVYRSDSPTGAKTGISGWIYSNTSFDDTSVSPGVHYWYWVTSTLNWEFGQGDEGSTGSGASHTLTTTSTAGGTVSTPGIGSFQYGLGTTVSVTATAGLNHHFVNWTGTAVTAGKVANASSASTTVTMDGDYTLQANFGIEERTLTTSSTAGGTVSTPGIGSYSYDHATPASVVATAEANYYFVNWTGTAVTAGKVANASSASTTVTVDGNYTLQANFGIEGRTLTTSSTAGGTVRTPGIGLFRYDHGSSASVVATAEANYYFVNWTGTAVTAGKVANASSASTTVTVDGNYTLQANFAVDRNTLTISAGSGGTVSTPGVGTFQYDHGTTVSVTAAAAANYHFVNWTGTAVTSGKVANATSATTTVTVDGNYTLQANFAIGQQTLTTSAASGGTVNTPGVGTFQYDHGTTVSVTATAAANYHFVNWTGTAVTSGKVANVTSATTTVTMDGNYTLQANFAVDRNTLTISAASGGTVSTPGVGTFQYDHGTTVSVAAAAASGYHFANWTGTAVTSGKVANATSATTTVTVDGNYTLQANFAVDRNTLTISAGSGGTVSTPGVGTFQYDHGTTVSVTATAAANYHFVNWTGTAVTSGKVANANSASTTVTMDGDYTLQANFAIGQQTLTTSAASGGTVSTPGVGTFQYDHGTTVSVTATAAANYHFVNWTGTAVTSGKVANATSATTTVTVDGNYTLQANFAIGQQTLTTSAASGGTVSTPGVGTFQYDHGTTVSVTATAAANYHFVNWTGTAVTSGKVANATSATTTVTVDGNYTLQANFAVDRNTLTISAGSGGTVSSPGVGTFQYDHGTTVSVTATAAANYHFVNWTGTAVTSGKVANANSASTTVTVDGNYTLQANFAIGQQTLTTSAASGGTVSTPGVGNFQYDHGTTVSVTATAGTNYHFVNWTGTAVTSGKVANATSATTTVTVDGNYTLQANFAVGQQTLTTSAASGGTVSTPGVGNFQYDHGTTVSVTATAAANYHFVNWTGTAVTSGKVANATSATTTVTMDGNYTLQANFAIGQQTLTISAASGGTVSTPGVGTFQYDHGATVSVTATAAANYHFVNWTGTAVTSGKVSDATSASTTVLMDGDYTLRADFEGTRYTLTITSTVGGSVAMPASGVGSYTYPAGALVWLDAATNPLFKFAGWRGGLYANESQASITMTADVAVEAHFESLLDTIYVDDDAPSDLGPDDANVSDLNQNGTASHPLDGIQKAIAVAKKGAKIVILPGTYLETIDLLGKGIELDGLTCGDGVIGSFPVINGQGKGTVVTCTQGEGTSCVLSGLVITGGRGRVAGGIVCLASSPSFVNCLIVGNHLSDPNDAGYIGESRQDVVNGGALYCRDSNATFVNCTIAGNWGVSGGPALGFKDSRVILANSIVWGNGPVAMVAQGTQQPVVTYSDVSGGWVGTGNLNKDPLFAVPGFWASPKDLTKVVNGSDPAAVWVKGDYHLRSQMGRWDSVLGWVKDVVASPCIDAGDPASLIGQEPNPNGLRINLGVYGGTCQASKSGGAGS